MSGSIIHNSPVLNTQGDQSKLLYQVPTLKISEDGTYDFIGIQAVNIFGGLNPAVSLKVEIDAATLQSTQTIVFVNTGMKLAALRLSNGGTVGGDPAYIFQPGDITFHVDGTNLRLDKI